MKRLIVYVLVIAVLGGCQDRGSPASAYRNWNDRLAVAAGFRDLGLVWPCTRKEQTDGVKVQERTATDQCYKMDAPRRRTGLWRNEFEGSRFCPAPATECAFDTPGDVIWLDPERVSKKEPDEALYRVEFIGRRTAVKGHYGHMGGSDYEIIVDRFISVTRVGAALR